MPATNIGLLKKLLQEMVVPDLQEIKSEIKLLHNENKRLDEKIDIGLKRLEEKIDTGLKRLDEKIDTGLKSLDSKIEGIKSEFVTNFKRLDEKIDSFREEFRSEIKRLDQRIDAVTREVIVTRDEFKLAIDLHERLAAVEAKLGH